MNCFYIFVAESNKKQESGGNFFVWLRPPIRCKTAVRIFWCLTWDWSIKSESARAWVRLETKQSQIEFFLLTAHKWRPSCWIHVENSLWCTRVSTRSLWIRALLVHYPTPFQTGTDQKFTAGVSQNEKKTTKRPLSQLGVVLETPVSYLTQPQMVYNWRVE